jgi:hypothetical protein
MSRLLLLTSWFTVACAGGGAAEPEDTNVEDAEDTAGPDVGEAVTLRNTPVDCVDFGNLAPVLPDEAGFYGAAALRSDGGPVSLSEIRYELAHSGACDASIPHRVFLHVVEDGFPAERPRELSVYKELDAEIEVDGPGRAEVILLLDEPISLRVGQELIVAVELAASVDGAASVCVALCGDDGGTAGLNWWSGASAAPFFWSDLVVDFGFGRDLIVSAAGERGR